MTATREAILCTILLELWKAYEVLDKYRCLDILTGHIVGTRALRLLRTYWDRLQMVTESGGYFRPPFKVYQGVTQGNTLYPNIFNLVVETVIRNCVVVLAQEEDGAEGLRETIQMLKVLYIRMVS